MKGGSIVWSDGKHTVTSPLLVTLQENEEEKEEDAEAEGYVS